MKRDENYTVALSSSYCCAGWHPECEIKRGTKLNISKADQREAEWTRGEKMLLKQQRSH